MSNLELRNISYIYSQGTPFEKKALDQVNVQFERGLITGLIGHTGCGKSTLVQLLNGLLKPSEGTVLLDGKDIWTEFPKIKDVRFKVGLVFQYPEYQLFEEDVYKDIAFGPKNMGLDKEEIDRRVKESAEFCGISSDLLFKSPFDLSGGQKRRVAIAGVMAMQPQVLILDEPAAGLDPLGREEILGGIWSYQRQKRITVIVVSHSMEDVARFSDRIVVMTQGKVLVQGKTKDIFKDADLLTQVGLDIPQITHLMKRIKSNGINIDTAVFTVEDAKKVLLEYMKN